MDPYKPPASAPAFVGAVRRTSVEGEAIEPSSREFVYAPLNSARGRDGLRAMERVTDGDSAISAMRLINSKVGPTVENARVVLVGADGREVCLTEEYLPHFDATASLGEIRVFLRKHGWVPEDERETSTSGAEEE